MRRCRQCFLTALRGCAALQLELTCGITFFRAQLSKTELESIRDTLHKGWVLGDNRFETKIEKLSGRRAAPLPKGRPRQA